MCGIYGILGLDGSPAAPDALRTMGRVTLHRGPDDQGTHCDGSLAFGMRRLSIIDAASLRCIRQASEDPNSPAAASICVMRLAPAPWF